MDPLTIDWSRLPQKVLDAAPAKAVLDMTRSWLAGAPVNKSEDRAALHMALRATEKSPISSAFTKPVLQERERQKHFVENCNASHILHIGIGGSDLGPRLVCSALQGHEANHKRRVDFLSTLTPDAIARTIHALNPEQSLVLLASKSFTTNEILYITQILTDTFLWPKERIVALTAQPEKAQALGIAPDHIFPFWDWVGGRYSLWSSIGLPIVLAYGWDKFLGLLSGAEAIDRTLYDNVENSLPWKLATVLHTLRISENRTGLAVLPYHADLALLPAWLQQLIMESNGKPGHKSPAPIVFGAPGTEFQHSFGQFLHQGPDLCTSVFVTLENREQVGWRQDAQARLNANAKAQADILWQGQPSDDPAKTLPGKRPSVTITLPDLSPFSLGALLVLFEHATVLDAFMSGINPFDQWGVEAGKALAQKRLKNGS